MKHANLVELVLLKDHNHERRDYRKREHIMVPSHTAGKLIEAGVAKKYVPTPPPPPKRVVVKPAPKPEPDAQPTENQE